LERRVSNFILPFLLTVVVGGVALALCVAALVPGLRQLALANRYTAGAPTLGELSQQTVVYDAAGTELGRLAFGEGTRQPVDLEEVPKLLRQAVIATEDQTFWTNPGFDVGGSARALFENLGSGRIEQGGSTITQQLVKIRFLNNRQDVKRKIREMVLAHRLTEKYTKRQILEQYLNTVYFGQGAYGVKAAVQHFFAKEDLAEVTIGDAALLAGVIRSPSADNPWDYPERATQRRHRVLDQMADQGYITKAEAAWVAATPLGIQTEKPTVDLRPTDAWMQKAQTVLLGDPRLGSTFEQRQKKLLQGGLKIYTTKDPRRQRQAEEAVRTGMLSAEAGLEAGLAAIEPATGYVRAMVDSRGYDASVFNLATDGAGEQVGSSFKVITLATLLANGYSPNDRVDGTGGCRLASHPGEPPIANAGRGGGSMTLQDATTGSVNCAYVRASGSVGLDKVAEMATKLGVRPDVSGRQPFENWAIPTLTLGVVSVTPLEMATVGGTLASGGERHDPIFVWKVEDARGRVIFDETNRPGERVLAPDVAACAVQVLHGPFGPRGTARGQAPVGHDAFGKTGTNDFKSSAAFLGGTADLVAFVWHGDAENPNSEETKGKAGFGAEVPLTIWKTFIDDALADTPDRPFPPAGPSCEAPGQRINPDGGRIELPPPRPEPNVVVPRRPAVPAAPDTVPPLDPLSQQQVPNPQP
jgi:penicillin-binding protein 1A